MRKILLLSIFVLSAVAAFAQYPAAPNKIALGRQTTGNGLVYITDSIPFWTPTTANNAWAAIDTLNEVLYFWKDGVWTAISGAGGTTIDSLTYASDTLYLYTSDGTFTTEIISSSGGVQYSDSLTVFVTPTQLSDSLAAQPQGTVTSVATGIGLTGGPITSTGTISADTTTVLASKTWVNTRGFPTGVGTANTIPVWSTTTALGDSPLTVSGTDVTATGTGAFRLPNGTTAQRPTPSAGMVRYNTSNSTMEYYGASAWEVPVRSATATGLFTNTHIPFTDANGRLTSSTKLRWTGDVLHIEGTTQSSSVMIRGGNATATGAHTIVGANAGTALTTAAAQTLIGQSAGNQTTTGNHNTFVGAQAGRYSNGAHARNTFMGYNAGQGSSGVSSGTDNTAVGENALHRYTSGVRNVAIGRSSANNLTTGNDNILIGETSGQSLTTGSNNTFIGRGAGVNTSTGGNNVFLGTLTGNKTTGLLTNAIGYNTVIGSNSARQTLAGNSAYNTLLGGNIEFQDSTGSNQLVISNVIFGTGASGTGKNIATGARIGINAVSPSRTLDINGEARIRDLVTTTPTLAVGADADGVLSAITIGSGLSLSGGTLTATGGSGTWLKPELESGNVTINNGTNSLRLNLQNSSSPTFSPALRFQHDGGNDDIYATAWEMADTVNNLYLREYYENGSYRRRSNTSMFLSTTDGAAVRIQSGNSLAQVWGGVDGYIQVSNGSGKGGRMRLTDYTNGGGYVQVSAPDTTDAAWTLTLPKNPGTSGQVLQTDGAGVTTWATAGSGGGGVSITSTTLETTPITAVIGKITLVDCSAAARTVTPPSSPAQNDRFAVSDARAASGTNNITVNFTAASQNLYGSAQNYIINANGGYIEFIYVDSTTGWIATKG